MTRVSPITNLFFFLLFSITFAGCNQEDFYQKEFLTNPFQSEPTDEGGDDGGSQGGDQAGGTDGSATAGTNGGTDGTATGGSNGGVDGTATAGTNGGVDGTATAGTNGGVDGSATAGTNGGVDGSTTGGTTGSSTGGTTGGDYGDCNQGHGNDDDHLDESNPTIGTDSRCKVETFRQAQENKKIDILWIIDNSGSMADEQTSLGVNFSAFVNSFIDKDVDFKMAITTTDTSTAEKKGRMVTGSDIKLTSEKAKLNENQFKEDFKSLVRVGTSGSSYEKGLAASEGFMQKYATTFLRQDAYFAVVIVSDEEDQSSKTVKQYTDFLKSYKLESGLVKIYSIADVNRTNSGAGITTGAARYIEASKQTAGVVADIRSDFHQSLSSMGDSLIRLLDSFALAQEPEPSSLKVYVNGVLSQDYTYDSSTRSIRFDSNHLPTTGSEIKVYYLKKQ